MTVKVGDRVRILVSGLYFAAVSAGDILTVEQTESTDNYDIFSADDWWFTAEDEGSGWEKVEGDQ